MFSGKYTPFRVMQIALSVWIMVAVLGSMISEIIPPTMFCHFCRLKVAVHGKGYCICYVLIGGMSLHLGLHWNMMMGMAKMFKKPSVVRSWLVKGIGFLIVGYGVYAFIKEK